MIKDIKKVLKLSEKRIQELEKTNEGWYGGYNTYMHEIKGELEEMQAEIKENNHVYLEDELGDVFWDYICLVHSLDTNKLIHKERVFKRVYKKFSERINGMHNGLKWEEIKVKQKVELQVEHEIENGKKGKKKKSFWKKLFQ